MTYGELLDAIEAQIIDALPGTAIASEMAVKIATLARDYFQPAGKTLALIPGEFDPVAVLKNEDNIKAVFAHFRTYKPRAFRVPRCVSKEWRHISLRLDEGFTVDDLKSAIDGYFASPWHRGENDRQREYLGLELMMRDGSKVQMGLDLREGKSRAVMSTKEMKGARAVGSWAAKSGGCK